MSIATFNTAKFQERLIKAKVDPNVAKAQADVLYEAMSQNVDSLATKELVNERFDNLNNSLDMRFNNVDVRGDALEKVFRQEAQHHADRFELHSNSIIKSINLLGERLDKKIDVGFAEAKADREAIRKEMAFMTNKMQTKMINWMFGSVGVLVTAGGIATAFILAK